MKGVRRTWVIDVCRTCGEHARWPFCVHRDLPAPPGGTSWCAPVRVTGTWRPAEPADTREAS